MIPADTTYQMWQKCWQLLNHDICQMPDSPIAQISYCISQFVKEFIQRQRAVEQLKIVNHVELTQPRFG